MNFNDNNLLQTTHFINNIKVVCVYIYLPNEKMSILAKSNQNFFFLNGLNIYLQIEEEEEKLFNL